MADPPPQPAPPQDQPPRLGGWRARLPNTLTMLRLATAPVVLVLLLVYRFPAQNRWALWTALVLFVLGVLTDALDGYLARRWNVVSRFGRIVDPLADKILVVGAFIVLALPHFNAPVLYDGGGGATVHVQVSGVQWWMALVIAAREVAVTLLRQRLESRGVDFSATASGKAKMILQSTTIPAILLLLALESGEAKNPAAQAARLAAINGGLALLATVVTALSLAPYLTRAMTALGSTRADLARTLAVTSGGLGFLRPAPGTWGSMPTAALVWALLVCGVSSPLINGLLGIVLAITSLTAMRLGTWAEQRLGRKDPSAFVLDETAGQVLPLLLWPASFCASCAVDWDGRWWADDALWRATLAVGGAFIAFRIMDIVKPPPARGLQRLSAGLGILIDDLIAGVYAAMVVQLVLRVVWPALGL